MFDNQISNIINSGIETKGLDLLNNQPSIGSLLEADQFSADEMQRFWLIFRHIYQSNVTGKEPFQAKCFDQY